MGFCSIPVQNSGLAQALNIADFELCFAGAAVGTGGNIYTLLAGQKAAAQKAFLAIGGTTNVASITAALIDAAVRNLVAPEQSQTVQYPNSFPSTAEQANLITGLDNHIAQIEAKATGGSNADCVAWAVQGLPIKQVLEVELVCKQAATLTDVVVFKAGPAVVIPEPVTLGSNSKIIKTGTTEIDFDTDYINLLVNDKFVFGALRTATNNTLVPATGDVLILRIKAVV